MAVTDPPSSATTDRSAPAWAVAVFAHNEARSIRTCLESILAADPGYDLRISVLANGCTDATAEIVRAVSREHPNVALISIQMGDKANAWNVYVHEIAGEAKVYFFVDGDVRVRPGALLHLRQVLLQNREANAAAALPASGRNLDTFRRDLVREHGLAGNLYALSAPFVERIRRAGIRLPVGLVGDDSLIGALAKWDLDADMRWNNARIVCAEGAEFAFELLSPFSPRHWRTYWRRLVRYKIRAYQNQLLRDLLRREGLAAMPRTVADLYRRSDLSSLRWFGRDAPIGLMALSQIRRAL